MSRENVEVVRKAFEAWNSGDMDALADLYDSDAIMRAPENWPEPGPFVGREAIMRQFEQVRETWDIDELTPHEFIDAGDRVLVPYAWRAVGHGPDLAVEWAVLYTLRNGKVVFLEYFQDHAEALEAVGLRE
jgi:ketosteroid isomerase-like protein